MGRDVAARCVRVAPVRGGLVKSAYQVGDTVYVVTRDGYFRHTVKEITRGGNYKLDNGAVYNSDTGRMRGHSVWDPAHIVEPTESVLSAYARDRAHRELSTARRQLTALIDKSTDLSALRDAIARLSQ